MANEYCDLIDKVCLEVIPGYKVIPKLTVKGDYEPNPSTRKHGVPACAINIKIKIGGNHGDS